VMYIRAVVACTLITVLTSCRSSSDPLVKHKENRYVLTWPVRAFPPDARASVELRIWREEEGLPSKVVMERRTQEASFEIPSTLAPGRYRWSVRHRYFVNGKERVTRWSRRSGDERSTLLPMRGLHLLIVQPKKPARR